MERAQRRARGSVDPPTCPRATQTFVGREAELARFVELLDQAVLFLVYGVAGIGKSELAFRAVEVARERSGWDNALSTLVQVQHGMDEQHLVAVLRLRTGAHRPPDRIGGPAPSLAEELEPVVRALNARPHLVVIDDLHLVDAAAAGRVLGHLARHVRKSRIIAASRLELPIPTEAVVTRLAPLAQPDAQKLVAGIGRRLGVEVADVAGILRRAGGSPFYLQREIVSSCADAAEPAEDPLDATLRALPVAARKLLLRAAVLSGRVRAAELGAGADGLAALARHFFVDVNDGMIAVHDLVRGAALRLASPGEVAAAHRAAARLLAARTSAGGAEGALAAVEAVRHLCAAGDAEGAFAFVADRFGAVSGAGLDHLLTGSMEEIRAAAPARSASVDLILARIFVRRSLLPEAQKMLDRLAADDAAAGSVHYLSLASTVASLRGDLRRAEDLLQRARRASAGGAERARIALNLADVLSLRGETARAREVLDEVRSVCETLGGRTALRWGWSAGFSWTMEQDFARTVAAVAPFGERAAALGAADFSAQLGMIELLARAELHDVAGARELSDRMVAPAARAGALRAPIAAFYSGVAAWAEGDLHAALAALRETWTFICAHDHAVLGPIVGHYLARVHLALGDVRAAVDLLARTTRRAAELGLGGITSVTSALYARVLVEAGEPRAARAQAAVAFSGNGATRPHSCAIAHQATALAFALDGDVGAARRHIGEALAAVPADAAERIDIMMDRAEVELCGGDPEVAVQAASASRIHYAARGRRYLEARACIALAAGHAALGGPGDLAMAEEALARADELTARHGYDYLHLRAVLARAAVAAQRGDRAAAERVLCEALVPGGGRTPGGGGLGFLLLGCALGSARERRLPAGLAAQLGLLGLRIAAPPPADVIVDTDNSVLTSRHGAVKGRPVLCALLACLIDGNGRLIPAETLYCTVWGAKEYHPLRHRNTLYVTMNRLRQALAELCPGHDGELIETRPAGWRVADGFVARKTM